MITTQWTTNTPSPFLLILSTEAERYLPHPRMVPLWQHQKTMQNYLKRPSLSTPATKGMLQKFVGILCSMRQKLNDKRHEKKLRIWSIFLLSQTSLLNSVLWLRSSSPLSAESVGMQYHPLSRKMWLRSTSASCTQRLEKQHCPSRRATGTWMTWWTTG